MQMRATNMKVLLKRNMFLGGILYEPNPAGTVLPDKIGDRTVVLYDPKNPPKARRDSKVLFEVSGDNQTMVRRQSDKLEQESVEDKDVHTLPPDVKLWTDKESKDWQPEGIPLLKGHPKLGVEVPLSALTPGLSKAETEMAINKDGVKEALVNKAEKERALLDPAIVGTRATGADGEGDNKAVFASDVKKSDDKGATEAKTVDDPKSGKFAAKP